MSANLHFNDFVNGVFGPNALNLADDATNSNKIIGAVSRFHTEGGYAFFTSNLKLRLARLKAAFPNQPSVILEKIKNLSNRNWMGYYSELVAADFYSILFDDVELEVNLPLSETLASKLTGRSHSSLDGAFHAFTKTYFEVKSFQDVTKVVLFRIADLVAKRLDKYVSVSQFPADEDYASRTIDVGKIVNEMVASYKLNASLSHPELPQVTFIAHPTRPKVITSISSYSPYRHAEAMEELPLIHFDQLVLKSPTILTYVCFPWFNLVPAYNEADRKELTRSFARRIFLKLGNDSRTLDLVDPVRFQGVKTTVSEAISYLPYVLFIFDNSVEPNFICNSNHQIETMEGYLYHNPKVNKSLAHLSVHTFLENISDYGTPLIRYSDGFTADTY